MNKTKSGIEIAIANFFKRLLGSRKMLLGVFGLVGIIISYLAPELAPRANEIAGAIFTLIAVVAGLIAAEDSVKAWASRPTNWQIAVEDILDELRATLPEKPPVEGSGGAG